MIYSVKISQLIDALNDFCRGVAPEALTDSKLRRVNGIVNTIALFFNKVMGGFPDVPLQIQNSMRMSLLQFTRRAQPLH